jgi:hypothetical protein
MTTISLEQLARLGHVEVIVPEFVQRLNDDWETLARLPKTQWKEAADQAHKLVSAAILVDALELADQLRILERRLRADAVEDEIQRLKEICQDEIVRVENSLRAATIRRQRVSASQRLS